MDRSYKEKTDYLNKVFEHWGDIVINQLPIDTGSKMTVAYIDDMVDRDMLERCVIKGLMIDIRLTGCKDISLEEYIKRGILIADYKDAEDLNSSIEEILSGNTLLIFEGREKAIVISSKGFPSRGVNKPETEVAVQGPQDAFSESFRTNTVLIRRRIRDTALKCKQFKAGRRSRTDVAIMYMEDIARPEIVMEAERRLRSIDIDIIIDSGYIEQLMEKKHRTPFPRMQLTERPDKAAAELAEGRIVIVVDNTPFVIILPAVLASFYQASEDYYQSWEIATFVRLIRYVAGFFCFCPAWAVYCSCAA